MTPPHADEDDFRTTGEVGEGTGPGDRAKADSRAWWRVLVEVATVIAVPSALLYVLGVLAFWLRIANEYDRVSIGTTWYAASLVPRSTAAASGMEAIGRGFVYGALASVLLLIATFLVLYRRARKGERRERVGFLSAPLIVPLSLLVAGLVSVVLNLFLSGGSGYGLLFVLRVVAVMVLLLILPMVYPLAFGTESERNPLRSAFRFYPRPVYWGIAAFLVVGVFASVLWPREASLSCLWKEDPKGEVFEANAAGTQSDAEPLQWTLQGGFLAKKDGTWYVLTEADRLQAIPDDDSTRVVGGDFSVRYQEVGSDGALVGEPVLKEDMKSQGTYVAVKHCSGFPSQPTITKLGNAEISQSNWWVRERTQGE